ncbi:MAG: hypothetical protein SFU56_20305 [Capsulimonadales bacterium]|nr:hypothetical protein [Capsulimonadales bacterium]
MGMWLCTDNGMAAYNLAAISRLFIEQTGTGAALKAEIAGKSLMIAYFSSRQDAQTTLKHILESQEKGQSVLHL